MEIRKAELGELQQLMKNELLHLYPEREIRGIISVLFSHLTGFSPAQLVLQKSRKLSESEIHFLQRALKRLLQHEPVQYITGKAFFYGFEFEVNKDVLIPRPETEELVDWIIRDSDSGQKLDAVDIGTGCGCIAVSLKKHMPGTSIDAVDISGGALSLAEKNAVIHGAAINFIHGSILDETFRDTMGIYDLIVSNPPYVSREDREKMLPNVTAFEPALALFVDEDPLLFYREIIKFSLDHLSKGGSLYFECNETFTGQVAELLKSAGSYEIEIRSDMQGKKRMLKGIKSGHFE
ncbi:MAG: peptide chain release factor N(5)-glutamine methyltransferase [Bacteroidales bacterium]|nr:peptide chain release factor N(5)-glutamine methyltransferase [Bacteroidales bacterium]